MRTAFKLIINSLLDFGIDLPLKSTKEYCHMLRVSGETVTFNFKALANEDTLLRTHCCWHKCIPVFATWKLKLTLILCSARLRAQETSWATMCRHQCVLVSQGLQGLTPLPTVLINTLLSRRDKTSNTARKLFIYATKNIARLISESKKKRWSLKSLLVGIDGAHVFLIGLLGRHNISIGKNSDQKTHAELELLFLHTEFLVSFFQIILF